MLIPDWLWIIPIGSLVAVSCSLVGTFLVLCRIVNGETRLLGARPARAFWVSKIVKLI